MNIGSIQNRSIGGYKNLRYMPQTAGNGFSAVLNQAGKPEQSINTDKPVSRQKTVSLSGSYQDQLEQLEKLNAETDWASMSDVEKVRVFEDRYRNVFGRAELTGLYTDFSPRSKEIYDSYLSDHDKYFGEVGRRDGLSGFKSDYMTCYREAYYGGLTDQEVRMAIKEESQGTGSMADKYIFLDECCRCGVTKEMDWKLRSGIENQLFEKVETTFGGRSLWGTGMSISEQPCFSDWFISFAKGIGVGESYHPSWEEVSQRTIKMYENAVVMTNS